MASSVGMERLPAVVRGASAREGKDWLKRGGVYGCAFDSASTIAAGSASGEAAKGPVIGRGLRQRLPAHGVLNAPPDGHKFCPVFTDAPPSWAAHRRRA